MKIEPETIKAIEDHLRSLADLVSSLVQETQDAKKPEPVAEVAVEPAKPKMTALELRKKLVPYSQAGHNGIIRQVLQEHGVSLVTELPEAEYEDVLREVVERCE